ncbi:Polyadenylate-binding protein-interacting protein 1 [Halotydeus destructor]|nr:Polyadenylate-binding protein-interacting protein 1 [Halotydeus destructor]
MSNVNSNDKHSANHGMDDVVSRTNELTLGTNGESNLSSDSVKSALNPAASVFVPRFLPKVALPPPQPAHVYYTPPSTTRNGWAAAEASANEFLDNVDVESDDYMALGELKEVIDNISQEPAAYETLIEHVTNVLNSCVDEDEDIVLSCVVNNVVDQAIVDQNFRYNGVRMCMHFIEYLKLNTSKGFTFKDLLLQRCQREVSRRESLARATDGGVYLRGVTLFLADLSTRISENEPIASLPELIMTMMKFPNVDNMKCVCNALKLAGPGMEKFAQQSGRKDVQEIFIKLQNHRDTERNSTIKDYITNLIEYKERGWQGVPLPANFYNPYAQENIAAAAVGGDSFLDIWYPPQSYQQEHHQEHQQHQQAAYGYPSYDFGPCGDEQDNDVVDAFEEFLRNSGQMN